MIYTIIVLSVTVVVLLFYLGYFYLLARLGEEMLKSKDSMILDLQIIIRKRNYKIRVLNSQIKHYKLRVDPIEWANYYFGELYTRNKHSKIK